MSMTLQDIRKEIDRLIDVGDEKALEKFFYERFSEFPEDIQKKVLFTVTMASMQKQASDHRIQEIQTKGLDAMDKLSAFKDSLLKAE